MEKNKRLLKRQLDLIDDLFGASIDEAEILRKHGVSRSIYNKWLGQHGFVEEFGRRVDFAYRQSELIMAKYAPLAAAKLVELTESEKEETRRRACLDIICGPKTAIKIQEQEEKAVVENGLSDEMACRLLAALAENRD